MTALDADEWACRYCDGTEHAAITFADEVEVDVTCRSVYVVPIDSGNGFAFTHADFERVIAHFESVTGAAEGADE